MVIGTAGNNNNNNNLLNHKPPPKWKYNPMLLIVILRTTTGSDGNHPDNESDIDAPSKTAETVPKISVARPQRR